MIVTTDVRHANLRDTLTNSKVRVDQPKPPERVKQFISLSFFVAMFIRNCKVFENFTKILGNKLGTNFMKIAL